jgi:hypothetical protein
VDARFDTALILIACDVFKPNHLLHRTPSIRMTGTSRITIAGHVRKIIGMPASANSSRTTKG